MIRSWFADIHPLTAGVVYDAPNDCVATIRNWSSADHEKVTDRDGKKEVTIQKYQSDSVALLDDTKTPDFSFDFRYGSINFTRDDLAFRYGPRCGKVT